MDTSAFYEHIHAASPVEDTTQIFSASIETPKAKEVPGYKGEYYIPYGDDNKMPFELINKVGDDDVLAQNKLFNILTCYGAGLAFHDTTTQQPTTNEEVKKWCARQNIPRFFLEQTTDLKYFYFTCVVFILNRAGDRINKIRHKDATFIRIGKANAKGHPEYVYSADWTKSNLQGSEVERIPLLDQYDPLGDLLVRLGKEPNDHGQYQNPTHQRKFALLISFPTPGAAYYPTPYWTAVFRSGTYDEKRLISVGKRAKLRNHSSLKHHVEIQSDYYERICREEHITDPKEALERIKKEKENINKFLTGPENSDKVWISLFQTDPTGKEKHDVRINVVETRKEGGEWAEDIQSAVNSMCYADSVHPNLVGAVPGKSQSNNSGSDKRELFTMKQALEIAPHDLLLQSLRLVADFHGWNVEPTVPMIQLTTLDEHKDSKKVNPRQNSQENADD